MRAIPTAPPSLAVEPGWMTSFHASLAQDDLAPATLRKGIIERVMGMSDLELGLQALLGNQLPSRR